ncbi:virulence factor TspB C-terminal domain-related protein [Vibrio ziniensis]|uniref:Uncharacterized protein n=1 Tax=Vibrio ziniensis TaxID=2711221 RepID=A0A6G7CI94_9VIBR|nr:virulence factor TspB C-terminal domain-related protein [Vibrio ziniensis]QIH41766.1 hypothetical protein G5S32_07085 [Vibrio ziniensis]
MVHYDVRNVCHLRIFTRLICAALLVWTPICTALEVKATWILKTEDYRDCLIITEEETATEALKEQCKSQIYESLTLPSPETYHVEFTSDLYQMKFYWGKFSASIRFARWQLINRKSAQNCKSDQVPTFPNTSCDPPIPTCADSDIQKEFQQAQYVCQINNPNSQLWNTDYRWSCEDVEGESPTMSSSCHYNPNNCIVGLSCKSDNDLPYCDPSKEECELPPQSTTPSDLPPIGGSTYDTVENIPSFCDMNPQLCEKQQPPVNRAEPNPNPVRKPPINSTLSAGDSEIVQEISVTNQHLGNVNANLKNLGGQLLDQLARGNEFSQHQLGVLREMLESLSRTKVVIPNEIGNDGKPTTKPMARADCDKSIFECRGDVIQCALLKVQYDNTCTADELVQLEEAFKGIKLLNNETLLVQSDTVDYSRMNQKYLSGGVSFGGGGCPAPERISFRAFGESKSIEFKFDPACRYAELLRPLLIAFAWLTGLFIIGRTQGAV